MPLRKLLEHAMFECISFFERIEDLHVKLKKGTYVLLIAEETPFLEILQKEGVTLCGAIFPRVIFKGKTYTQGIIAAKLSATSSMQIIDMDEPQQLRTDPNTSAIFAIVDGFSTQIDDFLEEFYSLLPEKTKLIGGGAGKTNLIQEPVIFDTYRFYMNAAIIITSPHTIGVGVKHGWKPLLGPFIATSCKGNVLEKMNYQDAFTIYKEAVENESGFCFDTTPFFQFSQRYPLGIVRYNKDFIVREPASTDGNAIVLVGDLDENSVLLILKGEKEDLLEAAKEAAQISRFNKEEDTVQSILLIDCIARYLFLEELFPKELEAISSVYPSKSLLWGALSLGEIANANQEGIEFYNKTCVVGTL
ncbi:FIST signal transduction protein [Sulfurospirillum multivorans]|uniref:FIST domain-containing signal transduction protein n=2 Tax=Sulfurospirillum multivorans TaxID=66821 RepID=A0AA86AL04_SULMK|nr:FIST C-terminal domain-containing protein [Sulfurospirillum multivorans]AHJ12404.1 putative FIST domain-containing signal transduction protein [Sulfurospirillum multivorans DSM 12446]QEH05902.1 putative FIST domain-containing signal transduction protein [Sulfurospirillum multivorans]